MLEGGNMRFSRRSILALSMFILLGALVFAAQRYETQRAVPGLAADSVEISVTNGGDRGPGTLREALFLAAATKGKASIAIKVPRISLASALPPIVNSQGGITIAAQQPGTEIDARALQGKAVFDVAGANIAIEGLTIRNCDGAAVLLRAARFRLQGMTLEGCDV